MSPRDHLRYVAAIIVGIFMIASGNDTWGYIGIGVLVLAVLAWFWHASLASKDGTSNSRD